MTTTTERTEGDRVCTFARLGAKQARSGGLSFPIWTGAIYEARRRQSDGKLTWRRVGSFGGDRSGKVPSKRFLAELKEAAEHEWVEPVRHGDEVR